MRVRRGHLRSDLQDVQPFRAQPELVESHAHVGGFLRIDESSLDAGVEREDPDAEALQLLEHLLEGRREAAPRGRGARVGEREPAREEQNRLGSVELSKDSRDVGHARVERIALGAQEVFSEAGCVEELPLELAAAQELSLLHLLSDEIAPHVGCREDAHGVDRAPQDARIAGEAGQRAQARVHLVNRGPVVLSEIRLDPAPRGAPDLADAKRGRIVVAVEQQHEPARTHARDLRREGRRTLQADSAPPAAGPFPGAEPAVASGSAVEIGAAAADSPFAARSEVGADGVRAGGYATRG